MRLEAGDSRCLSKLGHEQIGGTLRQCGDGEERVAPERARKDRSVADEEPSVDIGSFTREDAASVVSHAVCSVGCHRAASERMGRHRGMRLERAPRRIDDELPSERLGHLGELLVNRADNRLEPGARPAQSYPALFDRHAAPRVVMGGHGVALGAVDRGAKREA